ncbi:hypothetical protein [Rhizobium leguminosarum]|nr:hypothetical protein [Rhizobium leguminosarum]
MIYSEEKSRGLALPLIAILLAIAGAAGRVWVPQAQQQGSGR